MNKDQYRQFRNLIAEGELSDALKLLAEIAEATNQNRFINDILHQQGRLNSLQRDINRGTIDSRDAQVLQAKIRHATLTLGEKMAKNANISISDLRPIAQPSLETIAKRKSQTEESKPKEPKTPMPQPPDSNQKMPMFLGGLFTLLILAAVIFIPCPEEAQFRIFHTVLAIGVAGLAAVIPGFLNVKFNTAVTAGGALAVFALIYLWQPEYNFAYSKCGETTKNFTVKIETAPHLKDKDLSQYPPVGESAVLKIWHRNEWETAEIRNGVADFKNLDASFSGQILDLELESDYWALATASDSILFDGDSQSAFILPNGKLKFWRGKVLDSKSLEPLADVILEFENLSDTTGTDGLFEIEIPWEKQALNLKASIRKERYEMISPFVTPDLKIQEYRLTKKG